jgi:hypothetical protein
MKNKEIKNGKCRSSRLDMLWKTRRRANGRHRRRTQNPARGSLLFRKTESILVPNGEWRFTNP